jgi:hypothetical protein
LAEQVRHRHPRTSQRVLDRSAWHADTVRDDPRLWLALDGLGRALDLESNAGASDFTGTGRWRTRALV